MGQYKIGSDGGKATIDLEGGRLASLEIDGHEVLVTEGDKPTRWGSFPMIPWCGRLAEGRFDWYGKEYQFPLTSPPHANHGVAHLQTWRLLDHGESVINIALDMGFPWTFGGTIRQRFEITDDRLTIEARVEAGDYAMPVMIGWHPWFRRSLDIGEPAELTVAPRARYETDEALVPTGRIIDVGPEPWNDCFVDLEDAPVISWPGALDLTVSSDLDHWVVYTEPEHALCVEPQSGPPNQFNLRPRRLAPGQRFSAYMALRWN